MKRRGFIQSSIMAGIGAGLRCNRNSQNNGADKLKIPSETPSTVFYHKNDNPDIAMYKTISALGGIQTIIGKFDIVILKVNSQWWNQGMTNTDTLSAFISLVLDIPGFSGEIIVADNHQAAKNDSLGWTTSFRNGKFNLNELVNYFQDRGFRNVTKCHWHPAGPNPTPLQKDGSGNNVLKKAVDGEGYVWPSDKYYTSPFGNRCILAYPSFKSSFSGTGIDLRDGAFQNGQYTGQKTTFINFSSLNHHSVYCGATASIKNLMGVVDMSCGWPAPLPSATYNTHYVGATSMFKLLSANKMRRLKRYSLFKKAYLHHHIFKFHYTGGVLGAFMRIIRKPDLNIISAIKVGWGSRTDPDKAMYVNTVCASTDPVALDFWATRHLLYPATEKSTSGIALCHLNNPDNKSGPLHRFLFEAYREIGGAMSDDNISVKT